jgi:Fe-S cluster assembly ATP-binding protein
MLHIDQLHVKINDKPILKGLNLSIKAGEVHAIMGPNGAGKSTLGYVLAGREDYEVTGGSVDYLGEDLLEMSPEMRAGKGVFLGFQYPVVIPGVNNLYFLKAALNAIRKQRGETELDAVDFIACVKAKLPQVGLSEDFLYRNLNEGFSGGEKKRNEILQLLLLEPKLAILDETDSGLDIDALKTVAAGINSIRNKDRAVLLVTHYQRLLHYIQPDYVHVMMDGQIRQSGDHTLALALEERGYSWLEATSS